MFANRVDAGRQLGRRLQQWQGRNVVVLGLPRGGVPVAAEVARALGAPLDVILVRKLGVPAQPELAMGALGEDGVRVLIPETIRRAGVTEEALAAVEQRERTELRRRARRFRGDRARRTLEGKTAVVVDDGIATGSTARAACQVARALGAARVVLAVPVAPAGWTDGLKDSADELISLVTPRRLVAIGRWYTDFSQTTDHEVVACLERAGAGTGSAGSATADVTAGADYEVTVPAAGQLLPGRLTVPSQATGIVVFAHGTGSSRHSARNRFVATKLNEAALNGAGLGTLLLDLLTSAEELDRRTVFDIELLARRLAAATDWIREQPAAGRARIGYFGASTGAAAALWAAAERDAEVAAVVSCGGRPDLAASRLAEVSAPALLIVGGLDEALLALNRQAQARLGGHNRLAVVPGATHLFKEPGALEQVAALARDWFTRHLAAQPATAPEP